MIDLDLGGVVSAGTPLPEGDYEFDIADALLKKAAEGKTGHNLTLRLEVTDNNVSEVGRFHKENINIQESTRAGVKAFVTKWLGQTDDEVTRLQIKVNNPNDTETYDESIPDFTVTSINGKELIGSKIGATIRHKNEGGQVYGNVAAWHHVDENAPI